MLTLAGSGAGILRVTAHLKDFMLLKSTQKQLSEEVQKLMRAHSANPLAPPRAVRRRPHSGTTSVCTTRCRRLRALLAHVTATVEARVCVHGRVSLRAEHIVTWPSATTTKSIRRQVCSGEL